MGGWKNNLDDYRSNTLVDTEISPGPTSILFGKLPHNINRLLSRLAYNKTHKFSITTIKTLYTIEFLSKILWSYNILVPTLTPNNRNSKNNCIITKSGCKYTIIQVKNKISNSINNNNNKKGTFGRNDVAVMQITRRGLSERGRSEANGGSAVRGGCLYSSHLAFVICVWGLLR